jgi:hypothetical protein
MELKEKLLSSFIAFENDNSIGNTFVNEIRGEAIKNFEKKNNTHKTKTNHCTNTTIQINIKKYNT